MIGSHLLSVLVAAGDTAHASDHGHHSAHFPVALPTEGLGYAGLVLALPLIAMILNGVYAISGVRSKLPAWTTVACLGSAFAVVLNFYLKADIEHPVVVPLVRVDQPFVGNWCGLCPLWPVPRQSDAAVDAVCDGLGHLDRALCQ